MSELKRTHSDKTITCLAHLLGLLSVAKQPLDQHQLTEWGQLDEIREGGKPTIDDLCSLADEKIERTIRDDGETVYNLIKNSTGQESLFEHDGPLHGKDPKEFHLWIVGSGLRKATQACSWMPLDEYQDSYLLSHCSDYFALCRTADERLGLIKKIYHAYMAAGYDIGDLDFPGLKELSAAEAKILSGIGANLFLDGVLQIDGIVARLLSQHAGEVLSLGGLSTLSEEVAEALSEHRGVADGWGILCLDGITDLDRNCLLYTSPSPRDLSTSRMPSSA